MTARTRMTSAADRMLFNKRKEVQLFTTRQVSALLHSGIEPYPPIA